MPPRVISTMLSPVSARFCSMSLCNGYSARCASALAARLVKRWSGLSMALNNSGPTRNNLDRARFIFPQQFPCMDFAYAIAKQMSIQVMSHERIIHVIDWGCNDLKKWVLSIQSLRRVFDGTPHLKITYIKWQWKKCLGDEIDNIVAGEGLERHERYSKWMVRFGKAGFRPVHLWSETMDEAQLVFEAHGLKGYKIIN
ncbi:unnamed protein product [Fraxinus pennsylvanica]|uniref:Uncharacterized protein n=1 Tax=Fraxinus pennsylvanica TaxID=56036 RepID=A0AAD2DUN1_9LAMI|nr:unnamed protein product [Fraxinus pennsylvanica]